ncbi:unnamed protein product [Adineta steineri]|uniref:Uncharacterized protein n=1 Tax=Adineta steineri TaxID=433720 RepID=A0A818KWS0_9BILA|nr:unnamed protein product [Adineta steineri]
MTTHFGYLVVFSIVLFDSYKGFPNTGDKTKIDIDSIFENGPFGIAEASYEYPTTYDIELTPTSNNLTTQIRGQLYFPNFTAVNRKGPFPILVFLPGKHPDCRTPVPPGYPAIDINSTDSQGQCPDGMSKVANHLGYSYLGRYFASYGYIVASIDVVSINNKPGIDGDITLNFVRARLVLKTLEKMKEWNDSAEKCKQVLDGINLSAHFDFTQIGLMGHSRGGEGVRNAYNMLMENKGSSDTLMWRNRLAGMNIRAVMEIAPMYYGRDSVKLTVDNVPWAMMVAGCEDDELDYAHVRLASEQMKTAKHPNYVVHVYGANHEYFNSEWKIGIPSCFGDQDPLWDVNATTFKVSDILPYTLNTFLDFTLPKVNGSEAQRRITIFVLASFFRAYVGINADPSLATLLDPSTPLSGDLPEIGRQYFNPVQSILLFNGSDNIFGTPGIEMTPLQEYAQSTFDAFAKAYDASLVRPPQFTFMPSPPQKGNLSLDCLDQIENAIHVDFGNSTKDEILILFDKTHTLNLMTIDIHLARRSSCWFTSTHPSTCAEPREMKLEIQLQTSNGFITGTTVSLKSRYNMQFVLCNAMMDIPPEKLAFLPVMFETVRIPITNGVLITGIKLLSRNGGSVILGDIMGTIQAPSSMSSFLSMSPICAIFNFLLVIFVASHRI